MSRYASMFGRLGGDGAFGAFVMLGDPATSGLLDALPSMGADMVEVGIPFSDPVADGPVIQAAAKRAIDAGVAVADCFGLIAAFRTRHPSVPLGILTYANLVMAPGREQFFVRAAAAGADSLLVADLPAREAAPWAEGMSAAGLDPILIAASNTPPATLGDVARLGSGYVYCVTRAGITGTHAAAGFDRHLIDALAKAGAPPPIFGFGISAPDHVRAALAAGGAGAICGSAIVSAAVEGGDVERLVASLKDATRNESRPR